MKIETYIDSLIAYAMNCGLTEPEDHIVATNRILDLLRLDDYTPSDELLIEDLEEILKGILDYAVANGLCDDGITAKDIFDTRIMGALTPMPREVIGIFRYLYLQDPVAATDWYYKFSCDTDYIRRYRMKDGTVRTNPGMGNPNIECPLGEPDEQLQLVRFVRDGKREIAMINFQCHPDTIGGCKISADWPRVVRETVERVLDGVKCVLINGAQGDSNHIDYFKPKGSRRKGANGYEHSRYMGRTVADAVVNVWDKTEPMTDEGIFAEHTVLYNLTNTEGIEYYDDAVALDKEYSEKATAGNWSSSLFPKHPYIQSIAHCRRILSLRTAPIYLPIPLTVMGIGKVAIVGFGGEAFTSYSSLLKEAAPDKFMLTSVCSNGFEGYFPTAEAFKQGGYEVVSELYTPELEEQILTASKEMLNKF